MEQLTDKSGECWNWIGTKNRNGYGIIFWGSKKHKPRKMATRVAYEIAYGPFDKSLYVCHKCDNPSCVRPDHLFLGTQFDNMRDCAKKKRWKNQGSVPFKVKSPNGSIIEGSDLTIFCRKNNLNQAAMWCLINIKKGERYYRNHHKGYTKAP